MIRRRDTPYLTLSDQRNTDRDSAYANSLSKFGIKTKYHYRDFAVILIPNLNKLLAYAMSLSVFLLSDRM